LFSLKYSCGRDKVVILWDLETRKQLKTVALYDCIESMVVLPKKGFYLQFSEHKTGAYMTPSGVSVVVGGENGNYLISIKITNINYDNKIKLIEKNRQITNLGCSK
jgi:hypothetical protein